MGLGCNNLYWLVYLSHPLHLALSLSMSSDNMESIKPPNNVGLMVFNTCRASQKWASFCAPRVCTRPWNMHASNALISFDDTLTSSSKYLALALLVEEATTPLTPDLISASNATMHSSTYTQIVDDTLVKTAECFEYFVSLYITCDISNSLVGQNNWNWSLGSLTPRFLSLNRLTTRSTN